MADKTKAAATGAMASSAPQDVFESPGRDVERLSDEVAASSMRPWTRPLIAVVEDDASLLGALAFSLETYGFLVASYLTAGAMLSAGAAADCLVVDRKLPDMDGLALIALLRERGAGAPAILITTNPDDRCRELAARAGVTIVEKPLMNGELGLRIEQAIGGPAR